MRLRKRIEHHPWLAGGLGRLLALWVRLCHATTRWERRGDEAVAAALGAGPVIVVLWHERLAMTGVHWRDGWGPITALHATKFPGRVAGAMQARLGVDSIAMSPRASNLPASREVMRRLGRGISVALTADGPSGPARVPKDAPLDWARATGRPVFVYAFAQRGARRLSTWDRMVWPVPFTRGACVWSPWREEVPRRMDAAAVETLREDLRRALDAVGTEAEAIAQGRAGG